jgi:histidine triad (HIT) family protein
MSAPETVFSKIIRGEIPAKFVYQDEFVVAFHDINPVAPIHILVVPRAMILNVNEIIPENADVVAKMFIAVQKIAVQMGFDQTGYRLVMNNGKDGGQEVQHMHLHILAGRKFGGHVG